MASLPSPIQVAGNHSAIYEAYYQQADPNGCGRVEAADAARFLKKSGLSDVVLGKIWDYSDPQGRGYLDKAGLFVALKLVAASQTGLPTDFANVSMDLPPPKMGGTLPVIKPPKPAPPSSTPLITSLPPSAAGDWTVKPSDREKYDKLFESLQPQNGRIPGNKVKGVLMDSKLPVDTLGKIWDLADMDKDGMLDRNEFVIAIHLVYKALEKRAIPDALPPELLPPEPLAAPINRGLDGVKPREVPASSMKPLVQPLVAAVAPPAVQVAPLAPVVAPAAPQAPKWVITPEERVKYDVMFVKADVDRDGFVCGLEIKDVFLQSGVPQHILAHIWSLCDIKKTGKLNGEQFALAMWLVQRCLQGQEPPMALTNDMIPPSFRNAKADGVAENNNTPYSNPELDMISKDIEELAKEKLALETDIAQKEADIKVKNGEIKSLQSELDNLAATLKQLENQKGEAQKRLNDLKLQRSAVESDLDEVQIQLDEERGKVDKLRMQSCEQAEIIRTQEEELNSKREQLESLKKEEEDLEKQRKESDTKLNRLTTNLQEAQLQISQAKAKITQLQEQQRQMKDAISACDNAIDSGDASSVPDTALKISPEFRDPEFVRVGLVNGTSQQNGFGDFNKDDPFSSRNGPTDNRFDRDPFASDPFQNSNNIDAFGSSGPFSAAFPTKVADGFTSDPFASFGNSSSAKTDPFDPFGDGKAQVNAARSPAESGDKDQFGCDPFAILHAPPRDGSSPGRPSSPSPALPPKKSKQPPPRPAPPRPMQPPSRPPADPDPFKASNDPFSSSTSASGFADFADFDAKFSGVASSSFPTTNSNSNNSNSSSSSSRNPNKSNSNSSKSNNTSSNRTMDFADDPFRDYRYEDAFNIADPFEDDGQNGPGSEGTSSRLDAFGFPTFAVTASKEADGRLSVPLPARSSAADGRSSAPLRQQEALGEDQQLAWAAEEGLRLEEARKRRQIQEQAELDYAIALSKAET